MPPGKPDIRLHAFSRSHLAAERYSKSTAYWMRRMDMMKKRGRKINLEFEAAVLDSLVECTICLLKRVILERKGSHL